MVGSVVSDDGWSVKGIGLIKYNSSVNLVFTELVLWILVTLAVKTFTMD